MKSNINSFVDTQCAMWLRCVCILFSRSKIPVWMSSVFCCCDLKLDWHYVYECARFHLATIKMRCIAKFKNRFKFKYMMCALSVFSFHSMLNVFMRLRQSRAHTQIFTYSVYWIEFHRFSVNAILEWTIPFFQWSSLIKSKERSRKRAKEDKTVIKSLVIFRFI